MKKLLSLAALCALILYSPLHVRACLSLAPEGQYVDVTDESAIIVWDAKTRTQHFIRRASFDTKAKDIGFLVPTPNTPQLAEADDDAFYQIDTWMTPKTVYQTHRGYDFTPFIFGGGSRVRTVFNMSNNALSTSDIADTSDSVTIVSQQKVAGYDATVLAANNIPSLNRWLKKHNYVSTAALMKWLQPYVARKWKITAFKIAKPNKNDSGVSSRTVRMSFHTERPFFPYREPDQKRQAGSRILRVYFFAPQRMTGAINSKLWIGKTVWSDNVPTDDIPAFAKQLGLSSTQLNNARLTVLEDNSTVRYAPDDVYFQSAFDQSRVVPLPNIIYENKLIWLPADVLLLLSCGVASALYILWKRIVERKTPVIDA